MALIITLKPNEKIVINGVVLTNGPKRAEFSVMNESSLILREKDVLLEGDANTPAKKIYFVIQCMYLRGSFEASAEYHPVFFSLLNDFLEAAPSALPICDEICTSIMGDQMFKALKVCKKLIDYEKKLMEGF
jgi:flagellar protein FlbT